MSKDRGLRIYGAALALAVVFAIAASAIWLYKTRWSWDAHDVAMRRGHQALDNRDYGSAYQHFRRAGLAEDLQNAVSGEYCGRWESGLMASLEGMMAEGQSGEVLRIGREEDFSPARQVAFTALARHGGQEEAEHLLTLTGSVKSDDEARAMADALGAHHRSSSNARGQELRGPGCNKRNGAFESS